MIQNIRIIGTPFIDVQGKRRSSFKAELEVGGGELNDFFDTEPLDESIIIYEDGAWTTMTAAEFVSTYTTSNDDQTAEEVDTDGSPVNFTPALGNVQSWLDAIDDALGSISGATNLAVINQTTTTLDIQSDTGNDATIPAATTSLAGLMAALDKAKLDGIEDNATQDQNANEVPTSGSPSNFSPGSNDVQEWFDAIDTALGALSDTTFFTDDLTLQFDREHDLNGQDFAITNNGAPEYFIRYSESNDLAQFGFNEDNYMRVDGANDAIEISTGGNVKVTHSDGITTYNQRIAMSNAYDIRFFEQTINGTNYIALKAPDAVGTTTTFTLPEEGSLNEVLVTNGAGTLSFVDVSTLVTVENLFTNSLALSSSVEHDLQDNTFAIVNNNSIDIFLAHSEGSEFARFGYNSSNYVNVDGAEDWVEIYTGGTVKVRHQDGISSYFHSLLMDDQNELRFGELDTNGSNYVGLQAPASVASNITFTLPGADGSANGVLITNGAGTLSFADLDTVIGVDNSTIGFNTAGELTLLETYLQNVVEDTTPELGGQLDVGTFGLTGSTYTVNATGTLNFQATTNMTFLSFGPMGLVSVGAFTMGGTTTATITGTSGVTINGGTVDVYATTGDLSLGDQPMGSGRDIRIGTNGTTNNYIYFGNYQFDMNDTVSASEDNYVLTYDNGTGLITLEPSAGGDNFATADLDLTGNRTHDLNGNTLDIVDGVTNPIPKLKFDSSQSVLYYNSDNYVAVLNNGVALGTGGNTIIGTTATYATVSTPIRFIETSGGANYVSLAAAASLGSNIDFILPTADGNADGVLTTDGSGNWAFQDLSDIIPVDNSTIIVNGSGELEAVGGGGGTQYHGRYDTEASTLADNPTVETVELYYTARADGDGLFEGAQSNFATTGNIIRRRMWYINKAFAEIDDLAWVQYDTQPADDTTYATVKASLLEGLNEPTNGTTPLSLKITWADTSPFIGLVNSYPGAAGAYSVRRLSTSYEGPLMTVVRTSDSATYDVGYDDDGNMDTAGLLTFIGTDEGRVSTWYDQSGNGYDVTDQGNSGRRPVIVYSGGTLVTTNGQPSLDFNLTYGGCALATGVTSLTEFISDDITLIVVGTNEDTSTSTMVWIGEDSTGEKTYLRNVSSLTPQWVRDTAAGFDNFPSPVGALTSGAQFVQFMYSDLADQEMGWEINGTFSSGARSVGTMNTSDGLGFAAPNTTGGSGGFDGMFQEVIIYPTNENANRSGIIDNINTYYSIF